MSDSTLIVFCEYVGHEFPTLWMTSKVLFIKETKRRPRSTVLFMWNFNACIFSVCFFFEMSILITAGLNIHGAWDWYVFYFSLPSFLLSFFPQKMQYFDIIFLLMNVIFSHYNFENVNIFFIKIFTWRITFLSNLPVSAWECLRILLVSNTISTSLNKNFIQ